MKTHSLCAMIFYCVQIQVQYKCREKVTNIKWCLLNEMESYLRSHSLIGVLPFNKIKIFNHVRKVVHVMHFKFQDCDLLNEMLLASISFA